MNYEFSCQSACADCYQNSCITRSIHETLNHGIFVVNVFTKHNEQCTCIYVCVYNLVKMTDVITKRGF